MQELVIKNLHVSVEGKEILKGVNLVINKKDNVALLGPNGHGKSTLLAAIMGNPKYEVTEGEILIDGKDVLLENQLLSILNENLDLYDKYPQLHYEFIKNQEEIRFKTKDELVDNYILNKDKTKDQLLLELVVRGKRREELKRKNDIHNSVSK